MLSSAMFAARATMNPADFYTEFHPLLKGPAEKRPRKTRPDQDRAAALMGVLTSNGDGISYRPWMGAVRYDEGRSTTPLPQLDPRWLDAAVEAQALDLVRELARPGHPGANQFLSDQLRKAKNYHESREVLETMVRIAHPGAADGVIDALKAQSKDASSSYYAYWYGRMIADLPRSELGKFEQLLPTLPDKMVDQLMDSVLALKNKAE